jgi:hypothetical protein
VPSVRWKLEAYSCSGLTAQPLSSASWLLLIRFMMYNVAYFMLPPAVAVEHVVGGPVPHLGRSRGHWAAGLVLRLLALAATVQFVSAATSVLVSTVAWQAAGRPGILPSWMGWYRRWTAGWRVALALAAAATVVAALYSLSVLTRTRYERRTTSRPSLLLISAATTDHFSAVTSPRSSRCWCRAARRADSPRTWPSSCGLAVA